MSTWKLSTWKVSQQSSNRFSPNLTQNFSQKLSHWMQSKLVTTVVTTALITTIAPHYSANANSAIPIDTDNETWHFKTQVPDPEVSAYGGRMKVQDVDLAKMVSVTYRHCNSTRYKAAFWRYYAQGKLVGKFRFSCDLANDLVRTQGLGRSEPTVINLIGVGSSTVDIPTLDIEGSQAATWLQFTKNFKSMR